MSRDAAMLARAAAEAALSAGVSTIPPAENGTKRPCGPWQEYQRRLPTPDEIGRWYGPHVGVGFVCGAVSGGVELFEFDAREIYDAFKARAAEVGLGDLVERIEVGYLEETPGGGIHWFYRCDEVRGNTKLARRPGPADGAGRPTVEVLIETRGEGGYAVAAPSAGRVHPSGRPYRLLRGGVATLATLTAEERDALWDLARSFDEMPRARAKESSTPGATAGRHAPGLRPGADFTARTAWGEILGPHGWTEVYTRGETTFWRRPGKDIGISATTNHAGSDLFFVFTSSTGFEQQKSYTRFGAYAVLEHGGDYQAAARALGAAGYGEPARHNGSAGHGLANGSPAAATDDEDEIPVEVRAWPDPPEPVVYRGLAGRIVRLIAPHSEADPIALLVQLLVGFGNLIDRGAYFQVEATRHHLNLFAGLVGLSSKGRKGTAWDIVLSILGGVDPAWKDNRIQSGLSSGEGLIWAVRDPISKREPVKEKGRIIDYQENIVDPGIDDKRLLALETELGSTLKVLAREGNTLSGLIRQAWDSGTLRTMTKNSPARATGAHVSIIGHVTRDELARNLTATEAANGFANRFAWFCVRRSKCLPFGGRLLEVDFAEEARLLADVASIARNGVRLTRDDEADRLWAEVYEDLSEGKPGLLGSVLGRAEAQAMRLSCLYALLDGEKVVGREHLDAGLELWRYAERSARYIFGDVMGDPDADRLLAALRSAPEGLSRTQIRVDVFQRNKPSEEIARILGRLLEHGLVRTEKIDTGGKRPREQWYAINALNALLGQRRGDKGVNGVNGVGVNGDSPAERVEGDL